MAIPACIYWLRPTLGRCGLALLALDALLLLSQRFGWFEFSNRAGWSVMIAVIATVSVLALALLSFAASLLLGWRFQFSIRSLLVLIFAVAIASSWLASEMARAKAEHTTVLAIAELGGSYGYDYQPDCLEPPGPGWLRELLGDNFFTNVDFAALCFDVVNDNHLKLLRAIPHVRSLDLSSSRITDNGLEHLSGLQWLESLDLSYTNVSESARAKLKLALPQCTIHDDVGVASISGGDWIALAHITNLLESNGIKISMWGGSVIYGIQVPKAHADAAIRVLREDAEKRRYWIEIEGVNYFEEKEETRVLVEKPIAEALALPEFSSETTLGRFLKHAELASELRTFPIVASMKTRPREYLAEKDSLEMGYEVELELHAKPGDDSAGFRGSYYVFSSGESSSRGNSRWRRGL